MGKPTDPGYWRRWRVAHPEYRARESVRRRLRPRGDRAAEYTNRAARRRDAQAAAEPLPESPHPIMDAAIDAADRHVTRDRRATLLDPRWEEAVCVAALAICAGEDPDAAVMAHRRAEREWEHYRAPFDG